MAAIRVEGYPGGVAHVPARLIPLMVGPPLGPDDVSNGCGPKLGGTIAGRILTALIPDRPHGWPIVLGCALHDAAYDRGGDRRARRVADFNLARNIVTIISEVDGSLSAVRVFGIALCYWWAVRAGGWAAWSYRRRLDRRIAALPDGAPLTIACAEIPRPRDTWPGKLRAAVRLPWAAARLALHVARTV